MYRGGDGVRTLIAGGSLYHYEEQGFRVFSGEFPEFLIQYDRPEIHVYPRNVPLRPQVHTWKNIALKWQPFYGF